MSNKTAYSLCALLVLNAVMHVVWYVYDLPRWDISLVRVVLHQQVKP